MSVSLTVKNSCRRSEKGRLLRRTAAAKTRGDLGCCCPSRGTWPATPSLIPCRKDTSLLKIGTRRWTTCTGWVIETRSNCGSVAHKHLPDTQRTAHYVLTQCIISLCLHTRSCCTIATGWKSFRLPSASSIAIWRAMRRRKTNWEASPWDVF